MLALTLAALDAVRLHKAYVGTNRKHTLQAVGQTLLHIQHTTDVVAEEVTANLHLHLQCVEVVLPSWHPTLCTNPLGPFHDAL